MLWLLGKQATVVSMALSFVMGVLLSIEEKRIKKRRNSTSVLHRQMAQIQTIKTAAPSLPVFV